MNDFYTRNELGAKLAKAVGKSSLPLNSELAFGITTADFGFSKKFGNNGGVPSVIAVLSRLTEIPVIIAVSKMMLLALCLSATLTS